MATATMVPEHRAELILVLRLQHLTSQADSLVVIIADLTTATPRQRQASNTEADHLNNMAQGSMADKPMARSTSIISTADPSNNTTSTMDLHNKVAPMAVRSNQTRITVRKQGSEGKVVQLKHMDRTAPMVKLQVMEGLHRTITVHLPVKLAVTTADLAIMITSKLFSIAWMVLY